MRQVRMAGIGTFFRWSYEKRAADGLRLNRSRVVS